MKFQQITPQVEAITFQQLEDIANGRTNFEYKGTTIQKAFQNENVAYLVTENNSFEGESGNISFLFQIDDILVFEQTNIGTMATAYSISDFANNFKLTEF